MNQLDTDSIQYLSDAAEFISTDTAFRAAVNSVNASDATALQQSTEIRQQVLDILLQGGNHLKYRIGRLRAMPSRLPVRLLALRFLEDFEKRSLAGTKTDQSLTVEEQQKKQQAKDLYNTGRYQEALALGLELISQNPNLNNNLGIIGFIGHCYNKLDDLENAYLWARRELGMSSAGGTVLPSIDIITRFAFEQGRYEEIMELAEKYPHCKQDRDLAKRIAKTAYKLKHYKEALEAVKNYLFYCNKMKWASRDILEIGICSAIMLRDHRQTMRFCKLYLKTEKSLFVLQIAAVAAAKLGNSENSRAYRAEAEELERRIDSRGCPEIVQMFDCEGEEE